MAQITYVFAKGTRWREFAWQPGDKLVKSELPEDVREVLFAQLVADGNVVTREELEASPPRETEPGAEPHPAKGRKAKE